MSAMIVLLLAASESVMKVCVLDSQLHAMAGMSNVIIHKMSVITKTLVR